MVSNVHVHVLFVEITCPAPGEVQGAEMIFYGGSSYQKEVIYQCTDGATRFLDGFTIQTVKCDMPGVWDKNISNCEGRFTKIDLMKTYC